MFVWRNTSPSTVGRILVRMALHRAGRQTGAVILPFETGRDERISGSGPRNGRK
jgi:hypothetical protein